jgi:broad specificity phosphatase PhoE
VTVKTATARKPGPQGAAASPGAINEAFDRLFTLKDTGATEVILVCNAEPDYIAASRSKGPWDPPLTEKGRCQAMRLAMRLRRMHISAVFTSTMRQALETSTYIAAARDLPMVRVHQLREIEFDAAKLAGADGQKLAAELAIRFLNGPRWDSLPGFEPSRQFRRRVVQALEGILAHHPGERVVVVTHGGVINAYLSMLLDIPRDMFFLPEPASISVVRSLRDLTTVQRLNDFAHLLPMFNAR